MIEIEAKPETVIDELLYAGYRNNRDRGIPFEGMVLMGMFENVDELERRYQQEKVASESLE